MMYKLSFSGVAVTAVQDLFELVAPADAIVKIHSIRLAQYSDEGDAQAEMLRIRLLRGYTVSGSGGSTPTPAPLEKGAAAAGGIYEANNTTQANTGTPDALLEDAWNVQIPYLYQPAPEERPIVSPGIRCVLALAEAPADSINMQGEITFEEIGG
jgi:hypothetical protein